MTFRDAEAARRACADPTPIIDGRRANCNLASVGRPRPSMPYGMIFFAGICPNNFPLEISLLGHIITYLRWRFFKRFMTLLSGTFQNVKNYAIWINFL